MTYLHVIKGQQQGSKIELKAKKNYRVSSFIEDSDIYLAASERYSFNITVNDIGLQFSNIKNVELKTDEDEIVTEDKLYFFDLGLSFFDIKLKFSEDEVLAASELVTPEEPISLENSLLEEDADTDNNQALKLKWYAPKNLSAQAVLVLGIVTGYIVANITYLKARLGQYFYVVIGIIAFFLFLIITISIMVHAENKKEHDIQIKHNQIDTKRLIQQTLLKLPIDPYGDISVVAEKNYYVIKGVLPDQKSLDNLKSIFAKAHNLKIVYRIMFYADVKNVILQICKDNNIMHPNVSMIDNNGLGIYLSGIALDEDTINSTQIDVTNKFNEFQQVDISRIYVAKELSDFWNALPRDLLNQINIKYDYPNGQIIIDGAVSKNNLLLIENNILTFNDKYGRVVTAVSNVKDIVKTMPFTVKEVYIGPTISWLVTNDGAVIYVGGTYRGITLLAVNNNEITFRTSFVFTIPIDELVEHSDYEEKKRTSQTEPLIVPAI